MIIGCGDRRRSHGEVHDLFNARYPDDKPVTKSMVATKMKRFTETRTTKKGLKFGRPKSTCFSYFL